MSTPDPRLSQLQRTINAYRQAILTLDDAALAQLQAAYAPSRERLLGVIEALTGQMQGGVKLTTTEAMELGRARELLRLVEVESAKLARLTGELVPSAQSQAVAQAIERARTLTIAQGATVRDASRVAARWTGLNSNAVADLVGSLSDGSPLQAWMERVVPESVTAVRDTLLDGVARGINPEDLARRLAAVSDLPLERALTVSRTETMRSYRSAGLASMQANSDILAGYERSASLSVTSCAACIATAGKFYPLSHPFEEHVRGRCSPIPVLKDATLLADIQTGPEWFAEQSAATQKTILGPGAYEAYRRKEIALEDMAHVRRDDVWGNSVQRASLAQARRNARSRRSGGDRIAAGG